MANSTNAYGTCLCPSLRSMSYVQLRSACVFHHNMIMIVISDSLGAVEGGGGVACPLTNLTNLTKP